MSIQKTVGSVQRSFEIIEAVMELNGARISELSDYLEMTESSIHSHLTTLKKAGYIQKDGKTYDVGFRYLQLSRYAQHNHPIYRETKDRLNEIATETGEVASLMVEQDSLGYYIFGRKGPDTNQPNTEGKVSKLHCTAPGKAILAHYPQQRIEDVISQRGLDKITENTISEEKALFEELEKVRERGVAFNRGECLEGLRGVGVPIKGESGRVVGALGCYGPSQRMQGDLLEKQVPELLQAHANNIHLNVMYGD